MVQRPQPQVVANGRNDAMSRPLEKTLELYALVGSLLAGAFGLTGCEMLSGGGALPAAKDGPARLEGYSAVDHYNFGTAYEREGNLQAALDQYHNAVAADPQMAIAHVGIGNALAGLGREDEAEKAYENALKEDPRLPAALNNLADLMIRRRRNIPQARAYAEEAVEGFRRAWGEAVTRYQESNPDGAQEADEAKWEMENARMSLASALDTLGWSCRLLKEYAEAHHAWRQALTVIRSSDPEFGATMLHQIGETLIEEGKGAEAEGVLRQALLQTQNADLQAKARAALLTCFEKNAAAGAVPVSADKKP